MEFPATLIDLAGFIALLLWGTHMVQTGVQRAFGPRLKDVLARALGSRLRAFLAGLGVTAVLQSSTATGLMVTGFAAGGFVELMPALAVMLGANVGTTLIVQVLSFNISVVAPAFILLGVVLFRRGTGTPAHDSGRVMIGLGLMLLALHALLGVLTDFENAPFLRALLTTVSTMPLLAVLLATVLTWAVHSSVAVVLLIMSLSAHGIVPPAAAIALVLGANLGTAINPLIEGAAGRNPASRRVPVGNLITRIIGLLAVLVVLDPVSRLMATLQPDTARLVADFHTLFNLVVAVVFLPLLDPMARLLERLLPDRQKAADPATPIYLDPAARETPIVALERAASETLRLVDVLEEMLAGARAGLASGDRQAVTQARQRDTALDQLHTAIRAYLTSIDPDELSPADHRRLDEILAFAANLEQAGDVVDRYLLPQIEKGMKHGLVLPEAAQGDLAALLDRVMANLQAAATIFAKGDIALAQRLVDEKAAFRAAESRATADHFAGLHLSGPGGAAGGALHLDLLRDVKLINSHIVAAAAYPALHRTATPSQTRLAPAD